MDIMYKDNVQHLYGIEISPTHNTECFKYFAHFPALQD